MPALFVFLLKVNIALLLFCAGYYLVLRHLTFYTLNRVYLLAAILFASIYPKINLSAFVQRHEELVKPVQGVILNWQAPTQSLVNPPHGPDYWYWGQAIFWIGAGLLTIRLSVQLFSLYRLYKNSKPAIINNHQVRIMDKDAAPFSFWQSIFVNPSKHEPADLKAILLHEQVHVNEWHTADILLAELSTIFYWFNPGIWLIKKAIRENVEFITDRKILNKGFDSKTYQYSLVSVSFNNTQRSIVNHFNISTIKKRIIMMNAKRSSKIKLTRYAFLVPAVIALLLVFSISKADFAKPISIKFTNAIVKPLAKIVKASTNFNDNAIPVTAAKKQVIPTSKIKSLAITQAVIKTDTPKKTTVIKTVVSNKDSIVYFINGKKGDIKSVNPENIAHFYILTGADASPYINDKVNDDVRVALVYTKDSPEGQAIIDRLSKQWRHNPNVLLGAMAIKTDHHLTGVRSVDSSFSIQTINGLTKLVGQPLPPNDDQVNSNGNHKIITGKVIRSSSSETVTVNDKRISSSESATVNGTDKSISLSSGAITLTSNPNTGVRINTADNVDPLIVIDGKVSSPANLKNLNPGKIDSMTILNGDNATKLYGDKAKDGVVKITTKK
jgi:hypothetical protein